MIDSDTYTHQYPCVFYCVWVNSTYVYMNMYLYLNVGEAKAATAKRL